LSRTATLSLKQALTQLYGAKCYHYSEFFCGDQVITLLPLKDNGAPYSKLQKGAGKFKKSERLLVEKYIPGSIVSQTF
jgi:hypothetical protein